MRLEKYRADIDGLRAIAVLAVLLAHYWPRLFPSGFLGVDIFFVISGYVITSSLDGRKDVTFRSFLVSFYSRRMRRILPALLVCILVVSIVSAILIPYPIASFKTAISAIFGFSNIYLLHASVDYFGQSSEFNLFTHTWSLGVEEQFYFVFPALFWFIYKSNNLTKRSKACTLIFIGLSLLGFVLLNQHSKEFAYFFTPVRVWEFAAGIFVYYKRKGLSRENSKLARVAFIGMIALFFLPVELQTLSTISVVIASCMFMLFNPNVGGLNRVLTSAPMLWIGLRTYSLYLWHWPVLVVFKRTVGDSGPYMLFLVVLSSVLIAHLSYMYVEQPFRKRKLVPRNVLRYSLALSMVSGTIVFSLALPLKNDLLIVPEYTGLSPVHSKLPCQAGTLDECIQRIEDKKHVIVIGDSHATNLVPSIRKASEQNDLSVSYFGGIKFIRSVFNDINCISSDCYAEELGQINDLFSKALKPGDIVAFSMSRSRLYLPSRYSYEAESRNGYENATKIKLLKEILSSLKGIITSKGGTLIFVDDIPVICPLSNFVRVNVSIGACEIDYEKSIDDRIPLTKLYLSLLGDRVLYLDPHNSLCNRERCGFFKNGTPIYTDTSPHISESNKYVLSTFFEYSIKSVIGN